MFQLKGRVWDYISDDAKDLVHRLLELDPDNRISIEEAITHPWIRPNRADGVSGEKISEINTKHTHSHTHAMTLTHTHTHAHARTCTLTHSPTLTHIHSLSHTHTLIHTLIHTLTHTHTHVHTKPQTAAFMCPKLRGKQR